MPSHVNAFGACLVKCETREDNKVLMVKSYNKDLYYLPGGKRDSGESDIEALMREINEEISINLIENSCQKIVEITAQADGKATGIQVTLTCYFADYQGELKPAAEIETMAWLGLDDMDQLSLAAKKVLLYLKEQQLLTHVTQVT